MKQAKETGYLELTRLTATYHLRVAKGSRDNMNGRAN